MLETAEAIGCPSAVFAHDFGCAVGTNGKMLPRWKLAFGAATLDFVVINAAAWISYIFAGGPWAGETPRYLLAMMMTALLCQLSFIQAQLYNAVALVDVIRAVKIILPRWSFVFLMLAASAALTHEPGLYSRLWFGMFYGGGFGFIAVARLMMAKQIRRWLQAGYWICSVAVVGDGPMAASLITHCRADGMGTRVTAFFADLDGMAQAVVEGMPCRGNLDDLVSYTRTNQVDLVILALPVAAHERVAGILRRLQSEPLTVRILPGMSGLNRISPFRLPRDELPGVQLIALADRPISGAGFFIKGVIDRIIALVGLVVLAPVFLLCALAIYLNSPGQVWFLQKRVGYKNSIFSIIKFRTMHQDVCGDKLPAYKADRRLFAVGRWLRRFSLDEMPQLLNVLRGEMSLVGPRPHMLGQLVEGHCFADAVDGYAARHCVKPGMTGWAQVNGWRGPAYTPEQIERRVEHDIYYIENWSLTFDLIILVKTIFVGFWGKNVF